MMGDMYKTLCIIFTLVCVTNSLSDDYQSDDETDETSYGLKDDMKVSREYALRCSRRYRPGVCVGSVVSVWTYVFDKQTCTERLGCPTSSRSNRFSSYKRCIRRCQALSDVYTRILAVEKENPSWSLTQLQRTYENATNWQNEVALDADIESDNSRRPVARENDYGAAADLRTGGNDVIDDVDNHLLPLNVDTFNEDPVSEIELKEFFSNFNV